MKPHPLEELILQQADAFNRNAPEEERIAIFKKIQKMQKEIMGRNQ